MIKTKYISKQLTKKLTEEKKREHARDAINKALQVKGVGVKRRRWED